MTDNNGPSSAVPIIDHVGIAVNSLEVAIPLWTALLGAPPVAEHLVESEQVRVAFFGGGVGRVELLEPTDKESPVARYLQSRGEGVHHLCVLVADLDEALMRAAEAGSEPISPPIRSGAEGGRVSFLRPRSVGGVLLELHEPADPA